MPIWQFEAVNWGKYFTQFRLLTKSVIRESVPEGS
ncbi:Uncharacterised protein [Serratia quinivorans]|nr:Uncharacterised protein [Serratia quinivorans]CAI0889003.1 Uncharacterised protein [Serratia quinivorans]CAI1539989.1 Uncharacterised protein [Serratia quinivorans]CAI1617858.1 Uncharacterised protein [Serratia quinivorans]CAI1677830.1 Uncharacterised protein [Serratia quinivorans]